MKSCDMEVLLLVPVALCSKLESMALFTLLLLVSISYVTCITYSLPSGDVWYSKMQKTSFKAAFDRCKDMEGNLIEIVDEISKTELAEFISPFSKTPFNIWIGATKKDDGTYSWITTDKPVDLELLPFDDSKPNCDDKCCNLVFEPTGSIYAVKCEEEGMEQTEVLGIVCQLIPVTKLTDALDDVKKDLREEQSERKKLGENLQKLSQSHYPFRKKTEEQFQSLQDSLTKEVENRENLGEQVTSLAKTAKTHGDDLESLKNNRTALFIVTAVCLVAVLGLFGMTCLVMKRQRQGGYSKY